MIRLILFLVAAVALAWGVVWMSDNPGQMSLNWGGWRIETSAGVLATAMLVFAVLIALIYRFWLFITRAPGRIGEAFKERRSRKGYKALTKGMVAVAAGDAEEAQRQVGKADGLLGEPPLTLLLKAQAAQLNGNEDAAQEFFNAMLEDPEMEFLGLRGLLNQAIKRGDEPAALELARRAQALKPKSVWLGDALFDLESRLGNWSAASDFLKVTDKAHARSKGDSRHRQAVVMLGESQQAEAANDTKAALKFATKAHDLDPAFIPAALRLAQLHLAGGNKRKASLTIETTWALATHPEMMTLYFDARGAEDGLKKVAAAEKLMGLNLNAPDGHIAMASSSLDAHLWGQARTHLERALDAGRATRTVFALFARLEDEESGDKEKVRGWLASAANAAAEPAWVCSDCGNVAQHWSPHCPKCHSFDTQNWQTPPGYGAVEEIADTPRLEQA
ncbi:heme biosynthesis protein HemY [Pseudomonadota bacterium]